MTETSRQQNLLICLCLAAAILGVYWPINHFQFIDYDDNLYITENPHLRGGLTLRELGWAFTTPLDQRMPVTWLARLLEGQLFGLNAGPYHLVNVLFHIANTLLLFGVLNRMTGARWRSAFVAALFALHPLHVESVAWVTGLKDVLSTCFWMLTVWAYVRYVETLNAQPSTLHAPLSAEASAKGEASAKAERSTLNVFYSLALLFFTLGLMSKPMVVTLPFVLLLLDYWPLGRTPWAKPAPIRSGPAVGDKAKRSLGQLLREKLLFFAAAAASCVVTYWAQRSLGAVASLENVPLDLRIANALVSYVGYLGKAFCPIGLAVFYPLDTKLSWIAAMAACVGLVGVTATVIWRAQRAPWLATGWFWYLGTLVPVIGLVQVGVAQAMADRYTYVPLVGLFMMLCWSVPWNTMGQPMLKVTVGVAAAVAVAVCAMLTRIQVGYWKDTETLFRHALNVTRGNWLAHNNLGNVLRNQGKLRDAMEHYEQAVRLKPDFAGAHYNLGLTLEQVGRVPEAIERYQEVLRLQPDDAEAHYSLGVALGRTGKTQEAIEHYRQSLRLKPDDARAHYGFGVTLWQAGQMSEAIEHWEQALRIKPHYAEAYNNLGVAFVKRGKQKDAIEHFEQALRIKPDYAEAQNNLAWLLATLAPAEGGNPVRAVTLAQRVCGQTGNRVTGYVDTLAVAYASAGRFSDAIATAQKAIELVGTAGQPELVREIEARLQLYREGHPYRQSRSPVQNQSIDVTSPHNP